MAAEHQPDAITLDLLMQPVHGLEVLLQLKNDPRTSKIPVIVVTIVDQPGIGTALGADEYLVNRWTRRRLLAAVERCLRSRGGAAPTRLFLWWKMTRLLVHRFHQILVGTESGSDARLIHDGDDNDGDLGRARVVFSLAAEPPARGRAA